MEYPAEMKDTQQDALIADVSHKIDRLHERLDEYNKEFIQLSTIVLGLDGRNGLKGHVADIDGRFSVYRDRMREEIKDMSKTLMEAIDGLKKETENNRRQRRAELIGCVTVILAVIGLIVRVM